MNKTLEFLENNHDRFEQELIDILKIPSISSNPDNNDDMVVMAELLKVFNQLDQSVLWDGWAHGLWNVVDHVSLI